MFNSIISGMCADGAPNFLGVIDFSVAPQLLFYSYIPVLIITVIFSLFIIRKGESNIENRILSAISLFFSFWVLNIFLQWIAVPNNIVFLAWQLTAIFELPIYLLSYYLIRVFISKKDISFIEKLVMSIIYLALIFITPTNLNMSGYDYSLCQGVLGGGWYVIYGIEILSIILIAFIGLIHSKKENDESVNRKKNILLTLAMVVFLGLFFTSNTVGELFNDYQVNFIGPLGMIAFLGIISYLIVKYKTFNSKLFGAQALIYSLWILVLSLFFINNINIIHLIILVTLALLIIIGIWLMKGVKTEIKQRERLEVLKLKLENANEKLKGLDKLKTEFLSLASHQLRSPLTAIKGYTSMILEGDFGEINQLAKDATERVYQSTINLTKIVEDLLNVSKIEQGGMKYEMAPFSVVEVASDMARDLSITAVKKNLKLSFESDDSKLCMVNGDKEKIRQVILNFIDNSIKYTKEGSILVSVRRVSDDVVFAVKDTGMGMTPEIKATLFQKFSRGDGARMNTGGSGLGLYLAKEIIEAHKGTVDLNSEGMGKGSTFSFTLTAIK